MCEVHFIDRFNPIGIYFSKGLFFAYQYTALECKIHYGHQRWANSGKMTAVQNDDNKLTV